MPWVAICERARVNCGRNRDTTYVNVVSSARQIQESAGDYITNHPAHPWADPAFKEFIVDLTDQQAQDIRDGTNPLAWDDLHSLPRWQQRNDGSGSTYEVGSWADPEDAQSAWQADTAIPDDRWIVRLYDGDPGVSGAHIASLDLDEDSFSGEKTIHLKLYTAADAPSGTNTQNQQTVIAGKLMVFDFTAGVTTFGIKTTTAGSITFPSNHAYKVIGPAAEDRVEFRIFGRSLEAPAG